MARISLSSKQSHTEMVNDNHAGENRPKDQEHAEKPEDGEMATSRGSPILW